ncbi:hypothetical protein ACDZ28_00630 (plasmid) [Paenibacillus sp. RS8]|uniref:hypothetical protein n=1 Tax=Paenibacillus sp. RS8 TaxID=3242681 RepID=UPI0035C20EEE
MNENNNKEIFREIESLKSSQIRVKSLEYILSFYKDLLNHIRTFGDVFESYKEDFENHKVEYQEDIEEIFKRNGIEDHNLILVLSRAEEKMLLLIECIQFITQSITGAIRPKRKGVQDTHKITKARLLETIKLLEQYVLSIQESSSQFLSTPFIETQRLRTLFMLDAMHQLLELTAAEPRFYPFLFEPKTVLMLEESSSSAKKFSIVKLQKKRYTDLKQYDFRFKFMERFLLSLEKVMRKEY